MGVQSENLLFKLALLLIGGIAAGFQFGLFAGVAAFFLFAAVAL